MGVGLLKYLDGTTDITRTVHFGKPSAHEKSCYTAVCGICQFLKTILFIGYMDYAEFKNVVVLNLALTILELLMVLGN